MPDAKTSDGLPDVAQLIGAVAKGDRAAFETLFGYFAPRIKSMLMRTGLDPASAEEIAQEGLLTVWRKAALFDPSGGGASAWIYTIARNLRIDALRRQQRSARTMTGLQREPHAEPPSPVILVANAQLEAKVRAAMTSLGADQRRVVTLSFFEDRPHPEIAKALGIPLGTVKSRLRLAMKHLRELLDDLS